MTPSPERHEPSTEATPQVDPIHALRINFDGGMPTITLVCPEAGGCLPPGYCSECGRNRGEIEREPCECCPDHATYCNAKEWCDAAGSIEWVAGEIVVPVEIEWDSDEGPTLSVGLDAPLIAAQARAAAVAEMVAWLREPDEALTLAFVRSAFDRHIRRPNSLQAKQARTDLNAVADAIEAEFGTGGGEHG